MKIERIDHYTIRTTPSDLERVRAFYVDVLGLAPGPRPAFGFAGYWLYADGVNPIVHLAALDADTAPAADAGAGPGRLERSAPSPTGRFDHVSFKARGLADIRATLTRHGLAWNEMPVPGFPLYQLFLRDPAGVKVEMTFDLAEAQ